MTGRTACAAWLKASAAAGKAGAKAPRATVQSIVTALIRALDRVHAHHALDTALAEQAIDAIRALAKRFPKVTDADVERWLDENVRWLD